MSSGTIMAAQQLQRVKGQAEWIYQKGKREKRDYEERTQTLDRVRQFTNHELTICKSKLSKNRGKKAQNYKARLLKMLFLTFIILLTK